MALLEGRRLPDYEDMSCNVAEQEPDQASLARDESAKRELRAVRRAGPGSRAITPGDLAWTISLMEGVSRTEKKIADTMRVMAESGGSQAAERRLRLAEAATKGAQEAAERSEMLQRQADRLARHADVAALLHSLDHADRVLADLARTEKDIAGTLTRLAGRGGPDQAVQLRHQAEEALAAAQRANDWARSLHDLADSVAAENHQPSRSA